MESALIIATDPRFALNAPFAVSSHVRPDHPGFRFRRHP
jgi:hypothetical protein